MSARQSPRRLVAHPEDAPVCLGCERERKRAETILVDLENAEMSMRGLRRQNASLQAELRRFMEDSPEVAEIRAVLDYWNETVKSGRAKVPIDGTRAKKVKARLAEKFTVDDLKRAVDGARVAAYVDEKGKRHDDLELVCRDEKRVEDFIDRYEKWQQAQAAKRADVDLSALPDAETLAAWQERYAKHEKLAERMAQLKGWSLDAAADLGLGWDGERIVFPVRDATGELVNALRYQPGGKPKMIGVPKCPRELFPAPETISGDVWLVEGEPDAVAGRTLGVPAIAAPGASTWPAEWSSRFTGRDVYVCLDCDDPGRRAAKKIAQSLASFARTVRIVTLDVDRTDGYDLADFLVAGGTAKKLAALGRRGETVRPARPAPRRRTPERRRAAGERSIDAVLGALRARELATKARGDDRWECQCPAHEDRHPSLGVAYDGSKVLLHCQTGCETERVVAALGLEMTDLFDDRDEL